MSTRRPDRKRPKRIYLPWWGLTSICAALGFLVAEWFGAVFAGVLGFLAWKLR
jgi:cytochrome c oxidase subunit IV